MTNKVKVGIDEWLAGDAGRVSLMTDGLSGCVAVALAGNGKVALSHVSSECNSEEQWAKYKPKLDSALEASGLGTLSGQSAVLVCNQGGDATGSSAFLPGKLKTWLESKGMNVEIRQDSGCSIAATGCGLKKNANGDDYRYGYQNSMTPGVELSHDGRLVSPIPAGEKHPLPVDLAYRGTHLDAAPTAERAAHPQHALYEQILSKIPPGRVNEESAEDLKYSEHARNLAAALTVECVRKEIGSVDSLAFSGEGAYTRAFAVNGSAERPELMRQVSVDLNATMDKSMAALSGEASRLHNERVQQAAQTPTLTPTVEVATSSKTM